MFNKFTRFETEMQQGIVKESQDQRNREKAAQYYESLSSGKNLNEYHEMESAEQFSDLELRNFMRDMSDISVDDAVEGPEGSEVIMREDGYYVGEEGPYDILGCFNRVITGAA